MTSSSSAPRAQLQYAGGRAKVSIDGRQLIKCALAAAASDAYQHRRLAMLIHSATHTHTHTCAGMNMHVLMRTLSDKTIDNNSNKSYQYFALALVQNRKCYLSMTVKTSLEK